MTREEGRAALLQLTDTLVDRLQTLTLLLVEGSNKTSVVDAWNKVNTAAQAYADCLGEETGWGNPLLPLGDDGDGGSEDESVTMPAQRGELWRIQSEHLVRVHDDWALIQFTNRRLQSAKEQAWCTPEVDNTSDALTALHQLDSWRPDQYGPAMLEVEGGEWSVTAEEE